MKIGTVGADKWAFIMSKRHQNRVLITTLPLGQLQQWAHTTCCIKGDTV